MASALCIHAQPDICMLICYPIHDHRCRAQILSSIPSRARPHISLSSVLLSVMCYVWPLRIIQGLCEIIWFEKKSIGRSEEHTSELQSLRHLVCRLLLEKKK